MRLLNVKTLQLEQYFGVVGDGIPEYAILSHTWGAEEISFSEYMNGQARSSKGYEKILDCCKLADSEGFQYVWVDTCCIDKSSSVELSESINSMFQWYRDSRICYAYLSDVDGDEDPSAENSSFVQSVWFTRGWTLQELLAPVEVIFLGSDWQEIGSKSSLCSVVSHATRIDKAALEIDSWMNYSVAQKMSWAAGRQTTRLEDRAYSLMGLFDVNMPLLYGEGQKAFIRLQEEILKQTDDQSIFAWSIPEDLHSHVRLSGVLASSLEDFKDASMVESLGSEFVEDYENPLQLENRLVRLRLRMIDQVRGMKIQKVKGASQRYNAIQIEQDGTGHGIQLLRPSSPSGSTSTELAETREGEVEKLSVPTITINEALQPEPAAVHSKDSSDGLGGLQKVEERVHISNTSTENEKGEATDVTEVICDEGWRLYIYEPVIVVPLQCQIGGHQLAIMLTKGSIKAAGKVLSRIHNPSLITIDDMQEVRLTPPMTVYAEAHSKANQKLGGIRNLDRCLEIRIASLLDAGYTVHTLTPDWEYIPSRSALVEKGRTTYNDIGIFAVTPLVLFHCQRKLKKPKKPRKRSKKPPMRAEALVLSIPACQKDLLICDIDVIMTVPTRITARDYQSFHIKFSGHDSQNCVPLGDEDAILVKHRRGSKLVNISIEPIIESKRVLHEHQEPYMNKTIRLSSEIAPVLRSLREGLMEKPGISANIFDETSQLK